MAQSTTAVERDIAFLKSLAVAGSGAMPVGPVLMCAGLLFGTATMVGWAMATGAIAVGMQWYGMPYLGAWVLFAVCLFFIKRNTARDFESGKIKYGAISRGVGAAWSAVGAGILVMCLVCCIQAWVQLNPHMFNFIQPMVFTIYGMGWLVSALVARTRWMFLISAGCFATGLVAATVTGTVWGYPVGALGLAAFVALPGFLLMRNQAASAH